MKEERMLTHELLRFTTAGSVDDGKSTLIGRLLFDSKNIFRDQLLAIEKSSQRKGLKHIDLSLLTDGLKDEREQGITIDVAYRYFSTPKRKFIIADTPGHIQYTRNMVTGASTANAALILIDARKGVVEQTKRHSFIASLLQVQHIIICINKMDLVDYSQSRFDEIVEEYCNFASKLAIKDYAFIPISALNGDNVVNRSNEMPWYDGSTLMYSLENIQVANDVNHLDMRFPVQTVIRPKSKEFPDFRGYAGRLAGGIVRVNDEIKVLPSGMTSTVKAIHGPKGKIEEAFAPQSITIELSDDIDISRGDMLVKVNNVPDQQQEIDAMVCWLGTSPLTTGNKYALKHTSRDSRVIIQEIVYQTDLNSITRNEEVVELNTNDIGRIKLKSSIALIKDSYRQNKITGSFILIDEGTNNTVGAGMIL